MPVIGCDCEVCTSSDPRDQRLRTAALISVDGINLAIDCGPDFRQQMLRSRVQWLDAVLLTHEHNDHIIGLDDVRPFNFMNRIDMPVYATPRVADELQKRFAYIFSANPYPGAPMVRLHYIDKEHSFRVKDIPIIPVEVMHGHLPVLGFRIGNLAYLTDVRSIQPSELAKLQGLEVLVLNALHHKEHHTHLNLEQAVELAGQIGADRTFFTHMSHRMGRYAEINPQLPAGMELGYDGLEIWVG